MIRHRRRAAALAAGAALAALVPLGSAATSPAVASAAPRVACAEAAAHSEVTVAFVIDFSGAVGAPDNGIVKACVAVPSSDNDSEALAALATQQGFAIPRYSNSGLLCAIAGIPAKGCGQKVKDGFDYWAYWLGSPSGWTYANTGPAENQVNSSVVQGWRWEDPGKANPSDPQPRGPTIPGPICDPGPPPTTTTTTVKTTVPPTSVVHNTEPSSTVASESSTTSSSMTSLPGEPASTAAGNGSHQGSTSTSAAGSPATGRAAPTTASAAGRHGTTTSSTSAAATGQGSAPTAGDHAPGQLASSRPGSSQGSGGTQWLVIGLVVLVVGALGGVSAYRWRRTSSS